DNPSFAGLRFGVTNGYNAVYLAMAIVLLCIVIARNLERSRMGRAWIAIREDETAAEMMGVNTVRTKLLAFGLGASFAGFAGALQASYQGATTSDFFQFSTSILVVVMIILGGIGNIWGALVGALTIQYVDKTLLAWLGNRVNDLGDTIGNKMLSDIQLSGYNFLLFGLALVLMMRFRPEGFLPSRQRAAELHEAPPDQALASAAVLEQVTAEEPAVPRGAPEPGAPGGAENDAGGALSVDGVEATAPPVVTDESEPRDGPRGEGGEPR
ncbi:MAG: branched-chain amino acid ABC transporter permease, partial [Solirubrobacterales bacterium]|nr:branched-chain amino acid ABC transporter permease [Solirubrobacterales bacterium]